MTRAGRIFMLAAAALLSVAATRANWNVTVEETPAGGHRLGNPDAKAKLIEFVSYTCPHCAQFEREGDGPMRITYVATGKLSMEVRHLIRDPVDLTATVAARCGPKDKFFLNHAALMRSQPRWLEKARTASDGMTIRWRTGPSDQRMRAIATDLGLYQVMASRGYDKIALDRCFADVASARLIAEQSEAGSKEYGVTGTPSFVLDGVLLAGTHDWATLQPQLAARLD